MRQRRDLAGEILVNAKPPVDDDVVFVHVASEGMIGERLQRKEFDRAYRPIQLAGCHCTAITCTTAGSVVAIIEMVRDGMLPNSGFLKQEVVPLDAFLTTKTGGLYSNMDVDAKTEMAG